MVVSAFFKRFQWFAYNSFLSSHGKSFGKEGERLNNDVKLSQTERNNSSVTYVYTAYITTRNGRRIYAKAYGLNAFRIAVQADKQ